MTDLKNALLAALSSSGSILAAVVSPDAIAIIHAVVLPVVFFSLGKTADILLQIYLRRRSK